MKNKKLKVALYVIIGLFSVAISVSTFPTTGPLPTGYTVESDLPYW
jgi:hypothetical protein